MEYIVFIILIVVGFGGFFKIADNITKNTNLESEYKNLEAKYQKLKAENLDLRNENLSLKAEKVATKKTNKKSIEDLPKIEKVAKPRTRKTKKGN